MGFRDLFDSGGGEAASEGAKRLSHPLRKPDHRFFIPHHLISLGVDTSSLNLWLALPIPGKGIHKTARQLHESSSESKNDADHYGHIGELPKASDKPGESSKHARRRGSNSRRIVQP